MKILILFLALIISARAEIQPGDFLDALAMKETGTGWNGKPGPCGELSKWQIMPAVWIEEMRDEPFENARDEDRARVCALRHIDRLRKFTGDDVERLATCWHFGLGHRHRASTWGKEVENLYREIAR